MKACEGLSHFFFVRSRKFVDLVSWAALERNVPAEDRHWIMPALVRMLHMP